MYTSVHYTDDFTLSLAADRAGLTHRPTIAFWGFALKWTKCAQLILKRIIKTATTRCHILKLKCTKFDFCWGAAAHRKLTVHSTL